jgi:hypothetical protein
MKKAVLLALALILVVPASASAAPKVFFETPFAGPVFKPKRIEFHDTTLSRIHWRNWNKKVARGRSRARINTCIPFCADGKIVRGRARLAMFKRHTENGTRFYGCLTGRMRAEGKTYRVEWPPACAD